MSKLIEEILEYNPEEKKLNFKVNISEKIKNVLLFLKNKDNNEEEKKEILNTLINIFKQCKEISQVIINSPIFKLEENIGLIEILINIFLTSENLRESSKDLLKFLIENINFEKKYYDYIYRKLGEEHRKRSLNPQMLLKYMKILLLFYGKDIENKEDKNKYLFFLNPKESLIKTNISKENKLYLRNTFSIFLSFAIYKESDNEESDLIDLELDNKDHLKIKLEKNIIKVKYEEKLYNGLEMEIKKDKYETYCNELKMEIKEEEWISIQLYIEKGENGKTKIHLLKSINKIKEEKEEIKEDKKEETKEEKKEEKKEEEIIEEKVENVEIKGKKLITSITFLNNFKGKLSYIFCMKNYNKEAPLLLMKNLNKTKNEINETNLKIGDYYFIFSPFLFNELKFEINSLCNNYKCYLKNPENKIYQNYYFDYVNYRKNIFMIGGIEPIIPLFEFLSLFYQKDKKEQNEEAKQNCIEILNDLLLLIQILKQSEKNRLYIKESNFYKIISFFIENIPNYIINESNFLQFLFDSTEDNKINEIADNKHFYKYILFNFKLVEKLSIENRDKYFTFLLNGKLLEKIKENLYLPDILIYMKDYEIITTVMNEFLNHFYFILREKIEKNDKNSMTYFYKLLCEKYHPELIKLTFKLTKTVINEPNSNFVEVFQVHFRDNIISFLIKEKRVNMRIKMIKLIKILTEKFPNDLNNGSSLEISQLTDYLINNYRIDEFPEKCIEFAKEKFKIRPDKKFDIFFIEYMNIILRYIFIELVDLDKIGEISLIDPYKEYNDDFIFGIMKKIWKYNFSDEYANKVLTQNKFVNQFQKLLYYQIVIFDNYNNDEFKKKISDWQDYILRKLYSNNKKYIMTNPIQFLKKSLFHAFLFYLKEDNKERIKENYAVEYLNQLLNKFKPEIFLYIPKVYEPKTKVKNDVHTIYSNIMKQINDFIKEYNNHPNTQLKFDFDNLFFLDSFVIACIISKNSELVLSNPNESHSKSINKLFIIFDVKTLEFLCNYFIFNFSTVKVEDYRIIIIVQMIAICSNIERKKGMFSGNNPYSPENKEMLRKMFILLLKLLYIKNNFR